MSITVGFCMPLVVAEGKPFIEGVRHWPEGPWVAYNPAGCHLLYLYRNPTESEKKAFGGTARFALFYKYGTIFVLSRFGQMPWHDAPYNYSLDQGERHDLQAHLDEPGNRIFMNSYLIDASTGITEKVRVRTVSSDFTRRFVECVRLQAENPTTHEEHRNRIQRIYDQYPNPKLMVKDALVQCRGGD